MANPTQDTQTVTYNQQPQQNRPSNNGNDSTYAEYLKNQKKLGQKEADLLSKEDWLLHKRIKIANLEQQLIDQEKKDANTKRTNGQKQFRSLDQLLAKIDQNQKEEQRLKKKFIPDLALQYQKVQKDVLSKVGQVKYAAMHTPVSSGLAKPLTKAINKTGELLDLPPAFMFALKGITKPMELVAKGLDKGISAGMTKLAKASHERKAVNELVKHDDRFTGNKYAAENYLKQRRIDMKDLVELQNKQATIHELGGKSSKLDEQIEKILTRLQPPEKKESEPQKEVPQSVAEKVQTKLAAPPEKKEPKSKVSTTGSSELVPLVKAADMAARRNAMSSNKLLKQIATKLGSKTAPTGPEIKPVVSGKDSPKDTGIFSMFAPSLLKPIMSMIDGFKSFGTLAMSVGKNIFSVVKWLGRINPWVIGISVLVASLDFEKDLFEPIQDIIQTFTDGKWLEGIGKIFTFLPQTITKGFLRIGSWIAEKLGFADISEKLKGLADNFDLFGMLKGFLGKIIDGIGSTFTSMLKSLSSFTMTIPAMVPDFILNKIGLPREIKPFEGLAPTAPVSAPAAPPSSNVGANIEKSSVEVADAKSNQSVVIAPSNTSTTVVDARANTTAIGMRPRPRYKDESIMRHTRDSWSMAGGYSV